MSFLSLVIKHKLGALSREERVRRTLHLGPAVVAAITCAAIDSIGAFEQRAVVTITLRRNHVESLVFVERLRCPIETTSAALRQDFVLHCRSPRKRYRLRAPLEVGWVVSCIIQRILAPEPQLGTRSRRPCGFCLLAEEAVVHVGCPAIHCSLGFLVWFRLFLLARFGSPVSERRIVGGFVLHGVGTLEEVVIPPTQGRLFCSSRILEVASNDWGAVERLGRRVVHFLLFYKPRRQFFGHEIRLVTRDVCNRASQCNLVGLSGCGTWGFVKPLEVLSVDGSFSEGFARRCISIGTGYMSNWFGSPKLIVSMANRLVVYPCRRGPHGDAPEVPRDPCRRPTGPCEMVPMFRHSIKLVRVRDIFLRLFSHGWLDFTWDKFRSVRGFFQLLPAWCNEVGGLVERTSAWMNRFKLSPILWHFTVALVFLVDNAVWVGGSMRAAVASTRQETQSMRQSYTAQH